MQGARGAFNGFKQNFFKQGINDEIKSIIGGSSSKKFFFTQNKNSFGKNMFNQQMQVERAQ